jgi:ADP-ribose pyrophosphatase YjhB (NUDIX family)
VTRYFASDPTELGLSVSAMVWRDRKILLMRRSDNGHWGLPGGFVELGESVANAARREVVEETGWSVEIGQLIGVYSDPATQVVDYSRASHADPAEADAEVVGQPDVETDKGRGRVQIVNLCFQAKAVEQGEPTTPDETLEMGFFAADALPEPFVPIHRVRIEDGLAGNAAAAIR